MLNLTPPGMRWDRRPVSGGLDPTLLDRRNSQGAERGLQAQSYTIRSCLPKAGLRGLWVRPPCPTKGGAYSNSFVLLPCRDV